MVYSKVRHSGSLYHITDDYDAAVTYGAYLAKHSSLGNQMAHA